jgi:serine/threonine-protein kinase HipA
LNVAIVNPEDDEELALTLVGKKKKLKRAHFEQLGIVLTLTEKQIAGAFKRLEKNKPKAIEWINNSFISEDMKTNYKEILEQRYNQLGLVK